MYKFSEADKKALYISRGLQTEIVSASEFRQDMFQLHRKHLNPYALNQRLIIVRNFKVCEDMFAVTPLPPLGNFNAHEFAECVQGEMEIFRALNHR